MRGRIPLIAAALAGLVLILGVRLVPSLFKDSGSSGDASFHTRPGCTTVTVATSSEKAGILAQVAADYGRSGRTVAGACYDIKIESVASGTAEQALAHGWDPTTYGERPDAWTPAASTWVGLLRHDLQKSDQPVTIPDTTPSIASTPLVLAMPKPMAEALGWPTKPVGWSDVLDLARNPQGWASKGHPEWGAFKLGKTNPTISTSGLAATIGAFVAATGRSSDLTERDLSDPHNRDFVAGVEKSVVHYGDTTLTFLSNFQRADDAGNGLGYVSAVAVEEKSVLDYDAGNPTGSLASLGKHGPPSVPLVAVYPKEGTLASDSPFVVLKTSWTTPQTQAGAGDFLEYVRTGEVQKKFSDAGFRTYDGKPGTAIQKSPYVKADGPAILLGAPSPTVLADVRNAWAALRKPARVLFLVDESGSMSESVPGTASTRIDLAKLSLERAVRQFQPRDSVGIWGFTTFDNGSITHVVTPVQSVGSGVSRLQAAARSLDALQGTPLYAAIGQAVAAMRQGYDPSSINAVVVLTDGKNEYTDDDLDGLVARLGDPEKAGGIRVFSVAYGSDSDLATLQRISQASEAAAYDATNAASIDQVMTAVVSNF